MRTSLFLLYQDLIVSGRLAAFAAVFFLVVGTLLTACLLALVALKPGTAFAIQTIPYLVNFQGRLTDNNGNVLSDGSYNVKFRIYNTATGGAALWEEDRDFGGSDNRVTVQNGLFNIQLGSLSALSPTLFNEATQGNLYLEVELPTPGTATCASNGCASWTEGAMTPRQPIASSTYAFNSDTLDGIDSSGFVQLNPGSAQTGSVHVSGNLQADGSLQGSTASLTGTGSLTLGSSSALGQITFGDGANSNITILQSGSTGPPSLTLTLPSAYGSSGDCLKDTSGGGLLGFSSCSSGVTLQTVYDNSSTPALITTSSATKALIIQSGLGNNSTTAFAVIPDGTTTPTLNVDTQNNRVGIGTNTPSQALDVAGNIKTGTTSAAGAIMFQDGTANNYSVSLASPALIGSYNLDLPASAPTTSQCLKTDSVTAAQLDWTACGGGAVQAFDNSTASFTAGLANVPANSTGVAVETLVFTSATGVSNTAGATGFVAPAAGSFRTCLVKNNAAITAGTLSLRWRVNGTSVGAAACNMSTSSSRSATTALDTGTVTFNAGDTIGIAFDTSSTYTPTTDDYTAYWSVEYNATTSLGSVFLQGGNSFGAAGVLGTDDSNDLSLVTNGSERVRIDSTGKVGIGTAPGSDLINLGGSINLSSGSVYKINGSQIATADLSDASSITMQGNTFNGASQLLQLNGSGALPVVNAANLTSLNPTNLASGSGAVTLTSGGSNPLTLTAGSGTISLGSNTLQRAGPALTLDLATAGTSQLSVINSNGSNIANLSATGGLMIGSGQAVTVGAAVGTGVTCTGGDIIQNQTVAGGIVTGGTCASPGSPTLQDVYTNSTSPATMDLNTSGKDFVVNATDQSIDPNILFNLQCASCSSNGGRFAVQDNGSDVLTVNPTGQIIAAPVSGQNLTVNLPASSSLAISSATAPTTDQVSIDNSASAGVTTANASGLHINYKGGAAAVESSGLRIDYAPGSTSGSTWDGLRIVANATGAASGVTSYGLKLEGPTSSDGGTDEALYVGTGWDIGLDIQSGGIQMAAQNNPAAPAAGNLKIYAKAVAGRIVPKWIGPAGVDTPFQAALWGNNTAMWTTTNATAGLWQGTVGAGAGTYSTALPTTTNLYTSMIRGRWASVVTTTNQQVGQRSSQNQFYRGAVAGQGGFFFFARFGTEAWTAGDRLFVGLGTGTTGMVTGNPSSLTNILGFGIDAGDSAITFMHNDNSGTATKDAIAGQPTLAANQGYDVYIYAKPNDSTVYYRIDNLNTGATIVDTSTTTDLPVNTTMMAAFALMSNGANTPVTSAQIGLNRVYVETDH